MSQEVEDQTKRLDHLGIVAGGCREAGIAECLAQALTPTAGALGKENRERPGLPARGLRSTALRQIIGFRIST